MFVCLSVSLSIRLAVVPCNVLLRGLRCRRPSQASGLRGRDADGRLQRLVVVFGTWRCLDFFLVGVVSNPCCSGVGGSRRRLLDGGEKGQFEATTQRPSAHKAATIPAGFAPTLSPSLSRSRSLPLSLSHAHTQIRKTLRLLDQLFGRHSPV